VDGCEVSLLAFAVDHDGAQDCKRNAGRADRLFGGKFGSSIRVVRRRKIILGEVMIRIRTGLRGDRGNEHQMLCHAARYRPRQRRRRAMIDAIIKIVAGVLVGDAGKMNDGVALVQQRLPVEQSRQIRQRNGRHIWLVEGGYRSGCRDHPVPLRDKIGNQMTSDEPVGAGYEHPGFRPLTAALQVRHRQVRYG
jgi:hypothetical protein